MTTALPLGARALPLVALLVLPSIARGAPAAPEEAASLARRIFSDDAEDARAAMRRVFALAGVATRGAGGAASYAASPPVVPLTLEPYEIAAFAATAKDEPTLDLEELAVMLAQLGAFHVPPPPEAELERLATELEQARSDAEGAPGAEADREVERRRVALERAVAKGAADRFTESDVPELFALLLGDLVARARENPTSPHAFVPLWLDAMEKERARRDGRRPLDLALGGFTAGQVPLTLTEAELLLLALGRGNSSLAAGPAAPVYWASLGRPRLPDGGGGGGGGEGCSELLEKAVKDAGWKTWDWVPKGIGDKASDKVLDRVYSWLGFGEELEGKILKNTLKYGAKLLKLATWVRWANKTTIDLTAEPASVHYRHSSAEEREVVFQAKVRLPPVPSTPEEQASTRLYECLATTGGLNLPETATSFKDSMRDWNVWWKTDGLREHGTLSDRKGKNTFQHANPVPGNKLAPDGEGGKARLVVDVAAEEEKADERGKEQHGKMSVTAELDMSAAMKDPWALVKVGIDTWGGGVAEGTGEALFDIAAEWTKKWSPKKATARVAVSWHEPRRFGWRGKLVKDCRFSERKSWSEKTGPYFPVCAAAGVAWEIPPPGIKTTDTLSRLETRVEVAVVPTREGRLAHRLKIAAAFEDTTTTTENAQCVHQTDDGRFPRSTTTEDTVDSSKLEKALGGGTSVVGISFEKDGSYGIEATAGTVWGWGQRKVGATGRRCNGRPIGPNPREKRVFMKLEVPGITARGKGKPDDKQLTGSVEFPFPGPDSKHGTCTTTWNLTKVEVTGDE